MKWPTMICFLMEIYCMYHVMIAIFKITDSELSQTFDLGNTLINLWSFPCKRSCKEISLFHSIYNFFIHCLWTNLAKNKISCINGEHKTLLLLHFFLCFMDGLWQIVQCFIFFFFISHIKCTYILILYIKVSSCCKRCKVLRCDFKIIQMPDEG